MVRGTVVSGITNSILSITTGAVATNGCATRLEQNINVLAFSPVVSNCKCCNVTALQVAGGIPEHILSYSESEPTPDPQYPPSFLSSAYGTACEACNARLILNEVYTYESLSPSLEMVFYDTKQDNVLSNPFDGQDLFYKFTWGGEDPTDFDVVQISSGGVVTNLLDCETNCGSILNSYLNCGYGETISQAVNDSMINNRTLYSDCNSLSFAPLCSVYTDSTRTPLTGFSFVFINGATYSINPVNGIITGYTSEQA
jgi:hypothetical protein